MKKYAVCCTFFPQPSPIPLWCSIAVFQFRFPIEWGIETSSVACQFQLREFPFRNNMPASCKGNQCKPKQTFHPTPPLCLFGCHCYCLACVAVDVQRDWRLTLCARSNPRRAIYSPSRANTATATAVRRSTVSSSVLRFIPFTHALLKWGNLLSLNQPVLWCNG